MKATHKIRIAVGTKTYVQVRFGLYKVFEQDKHIGFANGVGEKIFC